MDWQKNRLTIGLVAFLIVGGLAIWAVRTKTGDTPSTDQPTIDGFPSGIERDAITSIEITRPNEDPVRLERGEHGWRLSAPVEARADQTSVDSALDKLAELTLESVAARSATHHEALEVDAAHGIHVIARGGERELANVWIGASRSGNTAVRLDGQDAVGMVDGSIRFAFNREVKDWRDRTMLDVEPDQVREVAWVGPNGSFQFTRPSTAAAAGEGAAAEGEGHAAEGHEGEGPAAPTLGDWTMTAISFVPPVEAPDGGVAPPPGPALTTIENFQPSKVRTMVSTLAHLRAADFAGARVTAEEAGFTDASARVTLTLADGSSHTLRLGGAVPGSSDQFYARRDGDETIFVVSRYHSARISPTAADFAPSTTTTSETPPPSEGAELDPSALGGQLPPELMRQLQQQLQQRGIQAPH